MLTVFGDVKLDNILFTNALYSLDDALDIFLAENPAETDGDSPKSQPVPHKWTYETSAFHAERMTVALVDLGHGMYLLFLPLLTFFLLTII